MSNVVDLDSRRRAATPCCPRHALDDLADRTGQRLARHEGQLLIPRNELEEALDDLRRLTEELLPLRHRMEDHP